MSSNHHVMVYPPDKLLFFKLTNHNELHHGFQYTTGLNIDSLQFNPTGECSSGGLYFFDETQLKHFFLYTTNIVYIREVTFPVDAKIYCEIDKYKCDKFILGERKRFYLDDHFSNEEVFEIIQQYGGGEVLKYVKEQTEEICLAAVKVNGLALKYVKVQTEEICLAAVQEYGRALESVKEQTSEICLAAVQRYGWALEFVKVQTPEICLAAVQQHRRALQYVKEQTPEICMAAVQQNGGALCHVKVQTDLLCLAAFLELSQ
uniref:DUF4116 domain-containing protein n=1 Tax=Marseillevirus LCMAC201 TaxID=2506605 RepID=A0A481YXM2_9VIRU|nr:MAG: protein of unknown function DUF4116 [Marseillevirus LCMAC201]